MVVSRQLLDALVRGFPLFLSNFSLDANSVEEIFSYSAMSY